MLLINLKLAGILLKCEIRFVYNKGTVHRTKQTAVYDSFNVVVVVYGSGETEFRVRSNIE